jgi:hypothetical protein
MCGIVVLQFSLLLGPIELLTTLVFLLLWSIPVLLCVGVIKMLQDIRDHPQSVERLEKRITKLKDKLLRPKY